MRLLLCFLLVLCAGHPLLAQKISYDVPARYERDISRADYKLIVDTSVAIIAGRYSIEFVKGGAIQLVQGSDMSTFNLDNLIGKCLAQQDRSVWGKVIHQHFESLFESFDLQKKIDYADFESVKKYLSLRIYPEATVAQRGGTENVVARVDLQGTYTVLMLDVPGAFTSVHRKMFQLWKKDSAEVFRAALANVSKHPVDKETKTFDAGGTPVEVGFIGEEDYAASYALDLQNNSPEFVGEWGCAIAIPNKGLVDVCKISREHPVEFVKFIQLTKSAVEQFYREHPQPVSTDYFWYYKGNFTRIYVVADDQGKVNVIAPMGLSELMTKKE